MCVGLASPDSTTFVRLPLARRASWYCICLASLVLALSVETSAHEFTITSVNLVVPGDGSFHARIGLDADALALGLPLEAASADVARAMREIPEGKLDAVVQAARTAVQADIRIAFDSSPVDFEVDFPQRGTPAATEADPPTLLGSLARLTGQIPGGARELTFQAPAKYKTVALEIVSPTLQTPFNILLEPNQASPRFPLVETDRQTRRPGVFVSYLRLGFTHIVPKGLDHILFVLGLFLLGTRWRPLFYQVTAFTLAHSVTLALSMQGMVSLPERLVETLIALSISCVAIENIVTSRLKPWRIALVFGFGLLHGLGFAGALSELGMPEGHFLTALLAFNLGVELGQVSVVLLALATLARFRDLDGYRRTVILPSSGAIAATGLWWAGTRAFG